MGELRAGELRAGEFVKSLHVARLFCLPKV